MMTYCRFMSDLMLYMVFVLTAQVIFHWVHGEPIMGLGTALTLTFVGTVGSIYFDHRYKFFSEQNRRRGYD